MSDFLKTAQQLLYNVNFDLDVKNELTILSNYNYFELVLELDSDEEKITFWVNIYNAYYQLLAKKNQTKSIFKERKINIANKLFSLDTIEHGILRKGKYIIGFGYLHNPFYSDYIKKLQVNVLDFRIHFALNCGAVSCPPILFYEFNKINEQLKLATSSFIETGTTINSNKKILEISKLFLWYKGDFGSNLKIKQIIGTIFNQNFKYYHLKFKEYNWKKKLNNFTD